MKAHGRSLAGITALILLAAFLLTLAAACSSGGGGGSRKKKEDSIGGIGGIEAEIKDEDEVAASLVGEWTTDVDATDMLKAELGEEYGSKVYGIYLTVELTLNEDGTYFARMDPESIENAIRSAFTQLLPDIKEMVREEAAAELDKPASRVTDEEIFELFREEAEMQVYSWDDLIDALIEEMGYDEIDEDETSTSGDYTVDGDRINIGDFTKNFADEDGYVPFKLTNRSLTLYAGTDDIEEPFNEMLPLKFTRK